WGYRGRVAHPSARVIVAGLPATLFVVLHFPPSASSQLLNVLAAPVSCRRHTCTTASRSGPTASASPRRTCTSASAQARSIWRWGRARTSPARPRNAGWPNRGSAVNAADDSEFPAAIPGPYCFSFEFTRVKDSASRLLRAIHELPSEKAEVTDGV